MSREFASLRLPFTLLWDFIQYLWDFFLLSYRKLIKFPYKGFSTESSNLSLNSLQIFLLNSVVMLLLTEYLNVRNSVIVYALPSLNQNAT